MGLELLTAGTGLLRQMIVAAQFGTSETTDAYVVAITVIGLVQLWLIVPIRQVILPLFRYDLVRYGEQQAWANISIILNNSFLVLLGVVLVGWFSASALVSLLSPGFTEEATALATELTQITMISLIFLVLGKVLEQILFAYERFFLPGISDLTNNIVTLIALLALGNSYGIHGLATAVVLGAVFEFFSQLPILWEKRKLYRREVDLRHPGMREVGRLSLPLLLSNSGVELARITDRIFASFLSVGSLSALSFASRPVSILLDIVVNPLQKSVFPHFTKLSAEENFSALSRQNAQYLRVMLFLTLPIGIGLLIVAEPVVRLLYQRGAFDETSVRLTSESLACYALGLPAIALSRVFNRTFLSLKDTWTPTKTSLLRIGIKILLSAVLVQPFAHIGLALAESLSHVIRTFMLFLLLPDQVKGQEGWNTIRSFRQTLVACSVMGFAVFLLKEQIAGLLSVPLEVTALVLFGCASYGAIAFVSKGEEAFSLLKVLTALGERYLSRKS